MRAAIAIPSPTPNHLARAAFALLAAEANSNEAPERACSRLFPRDTTAMSIVSRATVEPGKTDGWGSALVAESVLDFAATLGPGSAIATIMPRGITATFDRSGRLSVPQRAGRAVAAGGVGEGDPIPVRASTLNNVLLEPGKVATISVFTREVAKRGGAQPVVEAILREDAGASLDAAYLSTAAAGALPAGLLYGVSPIAASSAGGIAAMQEDLVALASAVAGSGQVVFIVSPATAVKFPILAPLLATQLTVLPSLAVADTRIIAIDPAALVHGFGGTPEIDVSQHTALHMSDTPEQISTPGSPATVAAPVRSMFQTDGIAVRMILDIAFGKRSASAAAYIDNFDWAQV